MSNRATGTTISQTTRCRLELLELPAPSDPVTGGKLYVLANRLLRVGDERTDVALANITRHNDPSFSVFAADLAGAERHLEVGDFAQRDKGWLRVGNRAVFAFCRVLAR